MDDLKKLGEKMPEIVKENKFALLGAAIGYLLSDSKEVQGTLLGAIAGSLMGDKKDGKQ